MGHTGSSHLGSQTFVGRCLWRLGRRPFFWFLCIWLGLVSVFVAVQMVVGITWAELGGRPPEPETINYRSYLPGGRSWTPLKLTIPEDELPEYKRPQRGRPQIYTKFGNDRLSLVNVDNWRSEVGWPQNFGLLSGWTAFDVTDPRAPFARRTGHLEEPMTRVDSGAVVTYSQDRSLGWWFEPNAQPLVYWVGGCFVLAALIGMLGTWVRFRANRRWRRGRCILCNHQLGPAPHSPRCPECGYAVRDHRPMVVQRLFGHRPIVWFLWMWLLCVCAVLLLTIATAYDHPVHDFNERYSSMRSDLVEYPDREVWPQKYELARLDYGWPFAAVIVKYDQWYAATLDQGPVPGPVSSIASQLYTGSRALSRVTILHPVDGQLGRLMVYHIRPWLTGLYVLLLTIPISLLMIVLLAGSGVIARMRGTADQMPSTDPAAVRSESPSD